MKNSNLFLQFSYLKIKLCSFLCRLNGFGIWSYLVLAVKHQLIVLQIINLIETQKHPNSLNLKKNVNYIFAKNYCCTGHNHIEGEKTKNLK